jgi:hypothetical protein
MLVLVKHIVICYDNTRVRNSLYKRAYISSCTSLLKTETNSKHAECKKFCSVVFFDNFFGITNIFSFGIIREIRIVFSAEFLWNCALLWWVAKIHISQSYSQSVSHSVNFPGGYYVCTIYVCSDLLCFEGYLGNFSCFI